MKTIYIFLVIILTTSLIYSQSSIVYEIGTTIDFGDGADICADTIIINGKKSGNGVFCVSPTAIENISDLSLPEEYSLSQNYPNPFNPTTNIYYQIPNAGIVTLNIYNVLGDEIAVLVNEEKPAGNYEVIFNASQLSSGIYFYKIQAGSFIVTKKMQLLK